MMDDLKLGVDRYSARRLRAPLLRASGTPSLVLESAFARFQCLSVSVHFASCFSFEPRRRIFSGLLLPCLPFASIRWSLKKRKPADASPRAFPSLFLASCFRFLYEDAASGTRFFKGRHHHSAERRLRGWRVRCVMIRRCVDEIG